MLSIKIAHLAELKGLSVSSISQSVSYLGVASFPDLSPQQGHTFMIGMLAESGGWKKLDKVGGYDHLPAF